MPRTYAIPQSVKSRAATSQAQGQDAAKRRVKGMRESPLVRSMRGQIELAGLPEPVTEHVFHPTRKWRFDLCYPALKIALEIEGGQWTGGRHQTGKGYEGDCIKYSEAALLGWVVIRATTDMVKDGRAIEMLKRALPKNDKLSTSKR